MKNEYNCYIVDDRQTDRLVTIAMVRRYPFLKITGSFENAAEALAGAETALPDVLFLDIDMPEVSGLELRTKLDKVPACIFISAYPEYAIQGFEVNALDFLTKPLSAERFDQSMDRLHYFLDIRARAEAGDKDGSGHTLGEDSLFIKEGHQHIRIRIGDIIYLEALKDYTGIITRDKKYCVLSSLGNLLTDKNFAGFVRIHRSYAVQRHFVRKIAPGSVLVDQVSLPVGRIYKDALNDLINP